MALKRVQRWMQGTGTPDPRNMFRDCYRMNIPDPREVSYDTMCIQIAMTNTKISRLAKDASALRRQHLQDLIKDAEEKSDTVRAQAILEILRREAQKKKWRKINYSIRPPHGAAPTCIQVETPTGTTTYRTEDEIFDHSAHHLSLQFRHAFSAPIYASSLLQKLGPLGDTDCAQEILDGTFAYPPDTDLWTTKFLRRLTTRMLCWGTRQSILRFPLPISKVSGNAPTRINRLHSVEDTTAFTRRRALINTFPRRKVDGMCTEGRRTC